LGEAHPELLGEGQTRLDVPGEIPNVIIYSIWNLAISKLVLLGILESNILHARKLA
jgi:hypothetical protein